MNYINYLQDKNEAQGRAVCEAITLLSELMAYLESPKFRGADNDYVQISTDIFPKIREARMSLLR